MGYYTDYKLSMNNADTEDKVMIKESLTEISGYSWYDYFELNDVKWYSHHEDMLEVSKKFPHVEFTLSGDGEEKGDNWIVIYKDGKHKRYEPEVIWPEINFNDL